MDILTKPEVINAITDALEKTGTFATVKQLDDAIIALKQRAASAAKTEFSMTSLIRGACAMKQHVLNEETKEQDLQYARQYQNVSKALVTGSTTGSYLVPTVQANDFIQMLTDGGVLRRMGPQVWPMAGIENLNIPGASATPTFEWLGQNTAQTASDPTLTQVALRMKTMRGLVALPNELLAVSNPAVDAIITQLLAVGAAEREDTDFFATSTASGGPTSVYAASSTTTRLANGNSANGGTVTYADLLQVLKLAYTAKARPPFVWAMHPAVFFNSILAMIDLNSRPIVQEVASSNGVNFNLFGYPVFLSALIPVNQTNGSGSSQSYILFTNPKYIHLGDQQNLEIAFSGDIYFDKNQTAVRAVRRIDIGYGPPAGIVLLKGCA